MVDELYPQITRKLEQLYCFEAGSESNVCTSEFALVELLVWPDEYSKSGQSERNRKIDMQASYASAAKCGTRSSSK